MTPRNSLPITVIVPSIGNPIIRTTLKSLHEPIDQLLIILNGHYSSASKDFETIIGTLGLDDLITNIDIIEETEKGLGVAYNSGMEKARNNAVVILDDDLIIGQNDLSCLYEEHNRSPDALIKGQVFYPSYLDWRKTLEDLWKHELPPEHQTNLINKLSLYLQTRLTANSRGVNTTGERLAYTPNVLIPQKVVDHLIKLDGYGFAEDLTTVDHEFNLRARAAGLETKFVDCAKVLHQPMTITGDFKSAWWYGENRAMRVLRSPEQRSHLLPEEEDFKLREIFDLPKAHFKHRDLITGVYHLLWQFQQYRAYQSYCVATRRIKE